MGTDPVRRILEDPHTRVLGEVLTAAESEHLWVRIGRDSQIQRARTGVIAARFRHFEDRDGGPLLHDHVLLSVKVRRLDDQWGTLHTRPFLEYAVALSELYNQRLMEEICEQFDLATVPRYPPACDRSWNSPASPSSSSTSPPPATPPPCGSWPRTNRPTGTAPAAGPL
jgi:hypothetical protein